MSNAHDAHHGGASPHGSIKAYVTGFVLSMVLTVAAYIPVTMYQSAHGGFFSKELLILFLLFLAMVQLFVQLYFFLHLGQEEKPRLNLVFFILTAGTIFVVVIGSIWIMDHLNHNMMPQDMSNFIIKDEGIQK